MGFYNDSNGITVNSLGLLNTETFPVGVLQLLALVSWQTHGF
jgi:hypothetical protein